MPDTTFVLGRWKVVCDRCGFRYHNTDLRKEWTGLMTCYGPGTNNCWEPRHPQDFVRGVRDRQAPPWTRPDPPDVFTSSAVMVDGEFLTLNGQNILEGDRDVKASDL